MKPNEDWHILHDKKVSDTHSFMGQMIRDKKNPAILQQEISTVEAEEEVVEDRALAKTTHRRALSSRRHERLLKHPSVWRNQEKIQPPIS